MEIKYKISKLMTFLNTKFMGLIDVAMQVRFTQNKLTMLPTKLLCWAKPAAPLSDFNFTKRDPNRDL